MAGERPAAYDEQTARRVLERLNALERKQNALLSGGYNQTFPRGPLVARWGRTTTNADYPTYPTDGNVVACELGDVDPSPLYPGLTAAKTFTAYDPQEVVVATLENGAIPSRGSVVRLTWRNGKWWIGASHLRKAKANASISAGGSGSIKLYNADGASETVTGYYTWADTGAPALSTNDEIWVVWIADEEKWYILPFGASGSGSTIPTCHFYGFRLYRPTDGYRSGSDIQWNKIGSIYWINSIGDVAGCNLDVKTSTVTAYTDYAMKVTAAGWYEFDWQVTGYEDIGNIDTGTDHGGYVTVTSENGGALSSHTHTFTGSNSTTSTHSGHTHGLSEVGAYTSDSGGSHSHSVTPLGSLSSDGSAADHTHDVKVPHGYWHTYALCSIKWRASGGAEGDWDLVATASTGSYVLPSSAEYGSANGTPYHSCAPKGFMYFDANTELVFRLHHVKKINDGDYNDLGYTFVQNRAYTNLTVRYHGNSLATATHYP